MTCGANGDPVPSVVWLKSNEAGMVKAFARMDNIVISMLPLLARP